MKKTFCYLIAVLWVLAPFVASYFILNWMISVTW